MAEENVLQLKKRIGLSAASAAFVFIVLAIVFRQLHIVPFSSCESGFSLATDDAYFQFIDYLAYMKDVLSGRQSVRYSFASFLGQNNIALFSYYLASPFNLALLFVPKENILVFFDMMILFKFCTSAFTFSWFATGRFGQALPSPFCIALSVGYGLMQYLLHQNYNMSYLDGVYMLPLMMLGVYRVIEKNKITTLSLTTGLAIIFNWYTAGINCIFSGFYFLFETGLFLVKSKEGRRFKLFFQKAFRYVSGMLFGVLTSAAVFFPTIYELRLGKAGDFDWYLLEGGLLGNPAELIHNYYLTSGYIDGGMFNTIFCGSFAILGAIGIFAVSRDVMPRKEKLIYLAMFVFLAFMFYWRPLFFIFSLLKKGAGHSGRYLYLGCFILLYLASVFYSRLEAVRWKAFACITAAYLAVFTALLFREPLEIPNRGYYTAAAILTAAVLVYCYSRFLINNGDKQNLSAPADEGEPSDGHGFFAGYISAAAAVFILAFCSFEAWYNSGRVLSLYLSDESAAAFPQYERAEQKLVDSIKAYDTDFYRITQTQTRTMRYDEETANYNEPIAFDYPSIDGYTSTPHVSQFKFMKKGGYRNELAAGTPSVCRNISILPFDSLLGVRYVMSPFEINGLEKVDVLDRENGKDVYENPFALPVAFKVSQAPAVPKAENPFEYNNLLYESITGKEAGLFSPVQFTRADDEDARTYELSLPRGNIDVFGYLPWSERVWGGADLDINGKLTFPYSRWNGIDLFYIPVDKGDKVAYTQLKGYNTENIVDEQFYSLDLDKLGEITQELKTHACDSLDITDGDIALTVTAKDGEKLFTSIPADRGWTITRNGQMTEPEIFEKCLMLIPLEDGINNITMTYHIPYLKESLWISAIGLILILADFMVLKKRSVVQQRIRCRGKIFVKE